MKEAVFFVLAIFFAIIAVKVLSKVLKIDLRKWRSGRQIINDSFKGPHSRP